MKIGFYLHWNKGSMDIQKKGNVIGEEIMVAGFSKYMLQDPAVTSVELYAPNHLPAEKLDMMIYMNDTPPNPEWAHKHVLFLQNAYDEGADNALNRLYKFNYDGFLIYSNRLFEMHLKTGRHGIFMPYGVDMDFFHPVAPDPAYAFDCTYVGNDIKGEYRTLKYIYPARKFNFGLYGNWAIPKLSFMRRLKKALGLKKYPDAKPYQKELSKLSQGKIAPYDQPKLYSSAKIILNCTLQDAVDWDVMTLRTTEVLACRGFLITDRTPIAEKLLKDCVVFTDGGQDLEDKIRYYLERPEERARIAENGYQYVLKHGSIEQRAKEMLAYLKTI